MSNRIIYAGITVFLAIFWTSFIWLGIKLAPKEHRIDCSVAEFHPDYTTEMKEQCRLVRSGRLL